MIAFALLLFLVETKTDWSRLLSLISGVVMWIYIVLTEPLRLLEWDFVDL